VVFVVTRVMQTLHDTRQLAAVGFTPDDVRAGLLAVVNEHSARRAELRSTERARASRRRALIGAAVVFVVSIVCIGISLSLRILIRPGYYSVGPASLTLAIVGTTFFGGSVLVLLRSPFRMPVSEFFFRAVWLGPVGRALVHVAGFRIRRDESAYVRSSSSPAVMRRSGGSAAEARAVMPADPGRIGNLESRVAELERWRVTMNERTDQR
jgi:hypothetical protein